MFDYLMSYFKPVERKKNGKIIVIIRGLRFQADTGADIISQIKKKIDFYRQEMSNDLKNVSYSLPGGNLHGKWNLNLVIFKNDIQNLNGFEDYLLKKAMINNQYHYNDCTLLEKRKNICKSRFEKY
ncbi:MAG: hypothetical protein ACOX0F_08000 [Syntrophomonadaceae bacterium]